MTPDIHCDNLDAYLADELHSDDAARFVAHLQECGVCYEAVDQQHWIDGLLQSPARTESPPETILESFRTSLARRRRYVRLTACGLASAAALLLAAGWIMLNRQASRPADSGVNRVAAMQTESVPAPEPPQATFVSSGDTIAIPLESPAPDVTVVQLYPTTVTERRWRYELVLQTTYPEPNGG